MSFRIREETPNEQRVVAAGHATQAIARRLIVLSALLAAVLLVVFAVKPPPSGAAQSRATTTTPGVSPVTVTVNGATSPAPTAPAATPPPVNAPPAKAPATVAPSQSSTPSAAPSAPVPPVSTGSAPSAVASSPRVSSPAHHRSTRTRTQTTVSQRRLRGVVVRLSRCVSRLNPRGQRVLLLRAGVSGAGPRNRRAVARTLHISVAHEARLEHAALLRIQKAAREQRCGSTPAWVHVPAGNHLVLVDPVLTAVTASSTKVSFTPGAGSTGSPLGPGFVFTWWRLAWAPAQQS